MTRCLSSSTLIGLSLYTRLLNFDFEEYGFLPVFNNELCSFPELFLVYMFVDESNPVYNYERYEEVTTIAFVMYYNLHKFIRLRLHYYVCSPENVCWVWKGIENKTKESEYDEREAFFRFGPVADYLVLYGQRFFVGGVSWEES